MRRRDNIQWDNDWINTHFNDYQAISDMYKAYRREVDDSIGHHTFRTHIMRMGYRSRLAQTKAWTKEESEWVRNNFSRLGGLKAEVEFQNVFGKSRTHRAIEAEARRQGLYVDADVVEANKNYSRRVPIGTIVDDGEGYLKIKTGKGSSGWERYHRYLYEKAHGPLPKGYKIMFLDNDRRNYSLDNMIAIPASYFALMNKLDLHSECLEINLTSIKWCDLYVALKKKGIILKRGKFILESM